MTAAITRLPPSLASLACECGRPASYLLAAATGADGEYHHSIPLCEECCHLEHASQLEHISDNSLSRNNHWLVYDFAWRLIPL